MLSSIAKFGSLVGATKQKIEGYLFTIVLDENNLYKDLEIEQFQVEKIPRYLYEKDGSKANKSAPIAPITSAEKTFKKIKDWINTCKKIPDITNSEEIPIDSIYNTLEKNGQIIIESLKNKTKELPKKGTKFLTIKLDNGKKYLGDYETFRWIYTQISLQRIQRSSAKNKACSILEKLKIMSLQEHMYTNLTLMISQALFINLISETSGKIYLFVRTVESY